MRKKSSLFGPFGSSFYDQKLGQKNIFEWKKLIDYQADEDMPDAVEKWNSHSLPNVAKHLPI